MKSGDQKTAKTFLEAREKLGLTQAQVAKKAGINANYYARVERGEPSPRWTIIKKIAVALDVDLSSLTDE